MNATTIDDARTGAIKARIAWLEEEEEQLARTAYSAQQNGYVDEDARLWAEAEMAGVRLEVLRLKASLEAGSDQVTNQTTAEEIRDLLRSRLTADDTIKEPTAIHSAARNAPSARAMLRAALGRDAPISLTEAAERLPWGDHETQWMVDAGITFQRGRYRYVLWGDVLDALPARDRPKKKRPRRRAGSRGAGGGKVEASDLPRF